MYNDIPIILWLLIGFVLGWAFLYYARSKDRNEHSILSFGLIIAALVYIIFAIVNGDLAWIGIEVLGVLFYGIFYFLGKRFHIAWIGVGWMLHPVWDYCLHFVGLGSDLAPGWYTIPCLTFDLLVACYIFMSLDRLKTIETNI